MLREVVVRLITLEERSRFDDLICAKHYLHSASMVVESFVDTQLFRGTAYKASGREALGPTQGFARHAQDFYVEHQRPKQIWVRELAPGTRAKLCLADAGTGEWKAACTIDSTSAPWRIKAGCACATTLKC